MNIIIVIAIATLAGPVAAAQQAVVTPPMQNSAAELNAARATYEAAQQAWAKNDPQLEAELNQGSEAQRKERIERARGLRQAAMQAQAHYYQAMSQFFSSHLNRWTSATVSKVDAGQMKAESEGMSKQLLIERSRLKDEIAHTPDKGAGGHALRSALEQEDKALSDVRDNVDTQSMLLDKIANSDKQLDEDHKHATETYNRIIGTLQQQTNSISQMSHDVDSYYNSLLSISERNGSSSPAPAPKRDPKPDPVAPMPSVTAQPVEPPPVKPRNQGALQPYGDGLYDGSWQFPTQNSYASGKVSITSANLVVREKDLSITGELNVVFEDNSHRSQTRKLLLTGQSRADQTTVNWRLAGGDVEGTATLDVAAAPDRNPGRLMIVEIVRSSSHDVPAPVKFGVNRIQ